LQKKDKYLSLLVFEESGLKSSRSFRVNIALLKSLPIIIIFFLAINFFLLYLAGKYYLENKSMIAYKIENNILKKKMVAYEVKFNNFENKLNKISVFEDKIKNITRLTIPGKEENSLAVGGKEFELIRDLNAISDRKEQNLFEELGQELNDLELELDKKVNSYLKLSNLLIENQLKVESTPSLWPAKGWISSPFGYRISSFTGSRVLHSGLDIATYHGAPIYATGNGLVVFAGYKPLYGNIVMIDHGYGYVTRYGHCSKILVKSGDFVKKGHIIAKIGSTGRSTGPHVHYEVLLSGIPANPIKFITEDNL